MRWIYGEVGPFKGVQSTLENYYAWIGARSIASAHLGGDCGDVKVCLDPNFKLSLENVRRSSAKASD